MVWNIRNNISLVFYIGYVPIFIGMVSYDLNTSIGKVDLIFTGSIIVFSVFSVREYGSVWAIVHGIFEIVYWRCDGFCGIGCGSWVVRKG